MRLVCRYLPPHCSSAPHPSLFLLNLAVLLQGSPRCFHQVLFQCRPRCCPIASYCVGSSQLHCPLVDSLLLQTLTVWRRLPLLTINGRVRRPAFLPFRSLQLSQWALRQVRWLATAEPIGHNLITTTTTTNIKSMLWSPPSERTCVRTVFVSSKLIDRSG